MNAIMNKKNALYALGMATVLAFAGGSSNAQAFDLHGIHGHHTHCYPTPCFPTHCHGPIYSPCYGPSFGISLNYQRVAYVEPTVYVTSSPVYVTSSPAVVVRDDSATLADIRRQEALKIALSAKQIAELRIEKLNNEIRNQSKIEGKAIGMTDEQIEKAAPGEISGKYAEKYGPSAAGQEIQRQMAEANNDLSKANAALQSLAR